MKVMMGRASTPRAGRGVARCALPPLHFDVPHAVQEEIVVEGLLHVTAVQAGSCMERFGDLDTATAPSVMPLSSALGDMTNASRNRVISEAICLATPPENPSEDHRASSAILRQAARSSVSSSSTRGAVVPEGEGEGSLLARMEATACERTALFNVYTAEMLQASASIRRQRRRAIVRALRTGKETTRALVGNLITSLSSWDSAEDEAQGSRCKSIEGNKE